VVLYINICTFISDFAQWLALITLATEFCMPHAIHDVITHANFCKDRLRGLAWQGVEFVITYIQYIYTYILD